MRWLPNEWCYWTETLALTSYRHECFTGNTLLVKFIQICFRERSWVFSMSSLGTEDIRRWRHFAPLHSTTVNETLPNAGWKKSSDRKVKFTDIIWLNKGMKMLKMPKCKKKREILQSKPKESHSRYSSRRVAVHIPFVFSIGFCCLCLSGKKSIRGWPKDVSFMLKWQKLTWSSEGASEWDIVLLREHKTFIFEQAWNVLS